MKRLVKKVNNVKETIQAYACNCSSCTSACASRCMQSSDFNQGVSDASVILNHYSTISGK